MKIYTNGTRFKNYSSYEIQKNRPYDYANKGLLNRLVSRRISSTTNPILKYVLQFVEQSLIFQMKYVDMLQNVFNYNWKNR